MPSVWSNPATRAALADALRGEPEPAPTWRSAEVYWLKLVDPTPEEAAQGRAVWSECRRCGVRDNLLLPADLGDAASRLREICEAHARCQQTLQGARWELLVTLRNRARTFGSYRCAQCGGQFEKTVSDETAEAEARALFGVEHAATAPGMALVCHECFERAVHP